MKNLDNQSKIIKSALVILITPLGFLLVYFLIGSTIDASFKSIENAGLKFLLLFYVGYVLLRLRSIWKQ